VPSGLIQVRYVTEELIASEQKLADNLYATGQITKKVVAKDIVDNLLTPTFTTE
jgi:hypothetical protein